MDPVHGRVAPGDAMTDLTSTLDELDREISAAPPERLPAILVALSTRMAAASARLLAMPPVSSGRTTGPDENLDVAEAARRLGVSKDWLYRHANGLPFTVRVGRRLVFSARGLERWNQMRQGR